MGGSNSTGTTQYIYLPTANGPMPIAAIVNGVAYAVHSDHLNTPRKLTQPDGQVAWQWAYSAFGDEQPTLGSKRFTNETTNPTTGTTPIPEVTFNLRYPGQYYDKESNLHYNYFRSYSAERGRYTQADPIGLEGGFNRFGYVEGDPLGFTDPQGLFVQGLGALCFTSPAGWLICGGAAAGAGLTMSSPSGRKIIKDISQKIEDLCQPDEQDPCDLMYEEERSDCWNKHGKFWGRSHFSYTGCIENAKTRKEQCKKGQPQIPRWSDGHVTGEPRISSRK